MPVKSYRAVLTELQFGRLKVLAGAFSARLWGSVKKASFYCSTFKVRPIIASFKQLAVVAALSSFSLCDAFSAQIAPSDYARLLSEAGKSRFTRVLITLDDTVTLEAMKNNLPAVRSAMEQKAKILLSELGQEALDTGYWNNGIGQIGVYLSTNGLRILMNSANAKAFMPDVTHKYRIQVHDADGSLDAIEDAINTKGFANVVVTLNTDGD